MKKLIFVLLILVFVIPGSSGAVGYGDGFSIIGGSGPDEITNIVKSKNGDYILLGRTNSKDGDLYEVSNDQNNPGMLMRVDSNGKLKWIKSIKTYSQIVNTSDDCYVLGGISSAPELDGITTKINNDGNVIWTYNDSFTRIAPSKDGGVFGIKYAEVGTPKITLVKLGADGQKEWEKVQDTELIIENKNELPYDPNILFDFNADKQGNLYIVQPIYRKGFDDRNINLGYLAGLKYFKFDSEGNLISQINLIGERTKQYYKLLTNNNGELLVFGNSGFDKFDSNGKIISVNTSLGCELTDKVSLNGDELLILNNAGLLRSTQDGKIISFTQTASMFPKNFLVLTNTNYVIVGETQSDTRSKYYSFEYGNGDGVIDFLTPSKALKTEFASYFSMKNGFVVNIKNYDTNFEYVVKSSKGRVKRYGQQIVVLDLKPNQSATVTVTTKRFSYPDGVATFIGYSQQEALKANFGPVKSLSNGFYTQITNYSNAYKWVASSTYGKVSISSTGLVKVTGLSKGKSATVKITTTRIGYTTVISSFKGSAE